MCTSTLARGKRYIGTSQCSPHSTPTRTNGPNYPKVLAARQAEKDAKEDPEEVARKKAKKAEKAEREEEVARKKAEREAKKAEREARKAKEREARKTGAWDKAEDKALTAHAEKAGEVKDWVRIAEGVPERDFKQCRDRWVNHLAPDINKGPWKKEEDEIILEQLRLGRGWADISKQLPGRPALSIKNRWNTKRKRQAEWQLDQAKASENEPQF